MQDTYRASWASSGDDVQRCKEEALVDRLVSTSRSCGVSASGPAWAPVSKANLCDYCLLGYSVKRRLLGCSVKRRLLVYSVKWQAPASVPRFMRGYLVKRRLLGCSVKRRLLGCPNTYTCTCIHARMQHAHDISDALTVLVVVLTQDCFL
jgi:hypothetical protein